MDNYIDIKGTRRTFVVSMTSSEVGHFTTNGDHFRVTFIKMARNGACDRIRVRDQYNKQIWVLHQEEFEKEQARAEET